MFTRTVHYQAGKYGKPKTVAIIGVAVPAVLAAAGIAIGALLNSIAGYIMAGVFLAATLAMACFAVWLVTVKYTLDMNGVTLSRTFGKTVFIPFSDLDSAELVDERPEGAINYKALKGSCVIRTISGPSYFISCTEDGFLKWILERAMHVTGEESEERDWKEEKISLSDDEHPIF